MGGAQPLAVTMNDGVALCIEVEPGRVQRRLETRYLDEVADDLESAVARCVEARDAREPLSVGVVGNAADIVPQLLEMDFPADIVTDQTSAHDPMSYVPVDLTPEAAARMQTEDPKGLIRRARESMARHCAAMVGFMDAGAEVFDYGNSLRTEARLGGFERAFDYPGFLPAYVRPLFCEGKGPFRWVALSGDPADIAATDRAVLEEFPDDEALARWIKLASERVEYQGLPARICWLGYGERHRLGLRFRLGRLALSRDRGHGRWIRCHCRLAVAQRATQHLVRSQLGEYPSWRGCRHRSLDPRRHGCRRRRIGAGRPAPCPGADCRSRHRCDAPRRRRLRDRQTSSSRAWCRSADGTFVTRARPLAGCRAVTLR